MQNLQNWEMYLVHHGVSIFVSLLLAGLGLWLAKLMRRRLIDFFARSGRNQAVKLFIVNVFYGFILVVFTIVVLGKLGVPTASLITILGTSSLAIGLAMKDFLANIAAGAIIVFQKPFEIGDFVEIDGTLGTVDHIDLFTVRLKTPSHEAVIIPNSTLLKEKIINKAFSGIRRIEFIFGVSYDSDIKSTKEILTQLIAKDKRVLLDPAPVVAVKELADSAVNLVVWIWADKANYLDVKFDLLENVKEAFDKAGIKIPYPHREVWFKNQN